MMAGAVVAFTHAVPGNGGMFGAIPVGAAVWFGALRLTAALKPEDVNRIASIGNGLPARFRPYWKRLIGLLTPAGAA
jgi:hypothetical protein